MSRTVSGENEAPSNRPKRLQGVTRMEEVVVKGTYVCCQIIEQNGVGFTPMFERKSKLKTTEMRARGACRQPT
jgi:hypothetical protein